MPKEYEYAFKNFDKNKIISKLKKLNGIYIGTFLFKVQQFNSPSNNCNINIRVRDEEYRITMTIKTPCEDGFDNEEEIIINNFNTGVNYLLNLGYTKSIYYEKNREIWKLGDTDIVFDTEAGMPYIMEIESPTFKELQKMVKIFNLGEKNAFFKFITNAKHIFLSIIK